MKFLNNLRLKTKLFAVVFFLVAVSVSISTTVYFATRDSIASAATAQVASDRLSIVRAAKTELLAYARAVEFLPLEVPDAKRKELEATADKDLQDLQRLIGAINPAVEAGRVAAQSAKDALATYIKDVHLPVRDLSRANKLDDATRIAFKGADIIEDIERKLSTIEERNANWQREAVAKMQSDQNKLLDSILLIAVSGSVFGLLAAFTTIIFGITKPLMKIIDTMHYLASGKTDRVVEGVDRQDELGGMAKAVETFRENAIERLRLEARARQERDAEANRQKHTDMLIAQFRSAITSVRRALDTELDGMKLS
jgi:methyl-accepting chemotaxis protein